MACSRRLFAATMLRKPMTVRSMATAQSIEATKVALRSADAVCFDFARRPRRMKYCTPF